MDYPCYPVTKAKDAFVLIGKRKLKLPRPEWKVRSRGKAIKCSYHLQASDDRKRYTILLQAETHWSNVISVHLDLSAFRATREEFKNNPAKATDLTWSSGGTNGGYTSTQIADTMASLWAMAGKIASRFESEVFNWAYTGE